MSMCWQVLALQAITKLLAQALGEVHLAAGACVAERENPAIALCVDLRQLLDFKHMTARELQGRTIGCLAGQHLLHNCSCPT